MVPDLQPHKNMVVPDLQPHKNHIIISTACWQDQIWILNWIACSWFKIMLPGQSHAHKRLTIFQGVLKKNQKKQTPLDTNQGENRLQITTIGIQMSDGYWTIISEGTPINEKIFTIQHEILSGYTTTKWARDELEDRGREHSGHMALYNETNSHSLFAPLVM